MPNNEYLDPERPPRVLSEPDITNTAIEGVEDVAERPLAYGLPRDEGGRLRHVVPELDGAPVYDHDRLPAVERSDLLPAALTVQSFDALAPTDLPARSTGLVFGHAGDDGTDGDGGSGDDSRGEAAVGYDLVPRTETEYVSAFAGPQLSFEFAVPKAAEDAVASHLTAPSAPWDQPRYGNPAADISDPVYRGALADRYDAVGAVRVNPADTEGGSSNAVRGLARAVDNRFDQAGHRSRQARRAEKL